MASSLLAASGDKAVTDRFPEWRRRWPGRDIADGASTFGAALSLADEEPLIDLFDEVLAAAPSAPSVSELSRVMQVDHDLALASRRWSENDDGLLFQHDSQFVPGDVVAMRSSAVTQTMQLVGDINHDAASGNRIVLERARRAGVIAQLVYAARPYWLPHHSAWGVMATKPLTAEDRSELRLPSPILVLFSAPMEITPDYIGTDLDVVDRMNASLEIDPDTPTDDPANPAAYAPLNVRSGTLAVLRFYNELMNDETGNGRVPLLGCQLMGAVLAPRPDGTLSDLVVWVLRKINPAPGATSRDVIHGGLTASASSGTFSLVEGNLQRCLLRSIAEALAAVVVWGAWTAPDPTTEPLTIGPGLRKQRRTSAFKKAEARGRFAGVHVLAPRGPAIRYSSSNPTGRTVKTHYRVGHWQRQRVGPRDNWTYERRRNPPVIVNAGIDEVEDLVRIYRLPSPPST